MMEYIDLCSSNKYTKTMNKTISSHDKKFQHSLPVLELNKRL